MIGALSYVPGGSFGIGARSKDYGKMWLASLKREWTSKELDSGVSEHDGSAGISVTAIVECDSESADDTAIKLINERIGKYNWEVESKTDWIKHGDDFNGAQLAYIFSL